LGAPLPVQFCDKAGRGMLPSADCFRCNAHGAGGLFRRYLLRRRAGGRCKVAR